ncbi:MAG: flagellar hook-associated protein FlgK [Firmicutes bacterium]|nr:flagellar hook-associated protein FlgK [Bacillota bacterium]
MSGIQGLGSAISGLNAAQAGLYVTGHNMANSGIEGYSRQRVNQADYRYRDVGRTANGVLQVGLGTDISDIRQLRWKFYDDAYRAENGRLGFYGAKAAAGAEIEGIIGENQSQYRFQLVIQDLWNSLHELSMNPDSQANRLGFIETCGTFVDKANDVFARLLDYQRNLNGQIVEAVGRVNAAVSEIDGLNRRIKAAEASGDRANDLRDRRNLLLDELSGLVSIGYRESPDGSVNILAEGKELLVNGAQNRLGLRYTSGDNAFVEPVFTRSENVLPSDAAADTYIPLFRFDSPVDARHANDVGSLKGMLMCRGTRPVTYLGAAAYSAPVNPGPASPGYPAYLAARRNYDNDLYSAENCFIPKIMRQADQICHSVMTMVNGAFAPAAGGVLPAGGPYDAFGLSSGTEIFARKNTPRWDASTAPPALIPENPGDYYSLYTIGNVFLNPELLLDGGYNKICLSASGDREDNTLIQSLLAAWKQNTVDMGPLGTLSVDEAYRRLTAGLGAETKEASGFAADQAVLTDQADKKRYSVMGVSLDEEMKNMMTYQYAYSAAARILNAVDSMLDRVINRTGRIGL